MVEPFTYMSLDDEPAAHEVLRLLMQQRSEFTDAGAFFDPAKARAAIERKKPDLLFLDIQMPDISGLTFLRGLADPPLTILVTAHAHHALEGFELGVRDYLLKPVSAARLDIALERVVPLISASRLGSDQGSDQLGQRALAFQCGYDSKLVHPNTILAVDAEGALARLKCTGGNLLVSHSLKDLEDRLQPLGFVRIHKSHMVNWQHVNSFNASEIQLSDGVSRPIGRAYRAKVKELSTTRNTAKNDREDECHA